MSFEFIQCVSQTSPHTRTCTKNSMHFVWELIRNAKKNAKTFETNKISDENLSSKECIICYLQQFPLETEAGPPWDVLPVHKYEYYIYSISYNKNTQLMKNTNDWIVSSDWIYCKPTCKTCYLQVFEHRCLKS